MKKCVLVSFFNSHNLGDCIIADMLYKMASEKFITEKYSYSGNPIIFTDINDISSTNSLKNKNVKGLIYKVVKKFSANIFINLYRVLKRKIIINRYCEFEKKIHNADLLVIGGGNMIFDIDKHSNSASRFNELVEIAKKRGIKVFVISIGIGPFVTSQQEIKAVDALKKCDYISFRDQKSFDIFANNTDNVKDVFLTVDPVFFLPYSLKTRVSNRLIVGLNVFNSKLIKDSEDNYKELIKGYVKLAQGLTNKIGADVVLFSTDLSDYETIHDVYNSLSNNQNIEIREVNGFESLIELYSEISVLVGTRMHSMIIAYTQHIPIIGISWQPKVDAFFEIIDSKDIYNYSVIGGYTDELIACCKKKLDNLNLEKNQIKEKLSRIKKNGDIDNVILFNMSQTNCEEKR